MIATLTRVAAVLQSLFLADADEVARLVGLVKRERKLKGSTWVQVLVFGWLERPQAVLEDLVDQAAKLGVPITAQALDQWFCREGAQCLQQLALRAVGKLVESQTAAVPLVQRFVGVYLEDCTTIALPPCLAEEYPGCGGNDPQGRDQAALKIYVRQEVCGGAVTEISFSSGRQPDVTAGQQAGPLPPGSLRLKDLGFFDTQMLAQDSQQSVHWISRLPSSVQVRCGSGPAEGVADFLRRQRGDSLDVRVQIGTEQPLSCRLLAVRCPEEVRQRRLRKLAEKARKKGRAASDRQRELCGWTLFITDLGLEQLTFDEAWVLYRLRWQIELLFKLWKGSNGLDKSRGHRGERILCELFAKLLGALVQNWLMLTADPWLDGKSRLRKVAVVRAFLDALVEAMGCLERLIEVMQKLCERLQRLAARSRRRKKPLTMDLLKEPARARLCLS